MSMTPAGIEPATFRIVAQHLNHCATAVPQYQTYPTNFSVSTNISVFFDKPEHFSMWILRAEKYEASLKNKR